jgi:hypothetical protein
LKKRMACLGLMMALVMPALAWRPAGWAFFNWPYAYDHGSGTWYYFRPATDPWSIRHGTAEGWRRLNSTGLAQGWSWHAWPFAYSQRNAAWHTFSDARNHGCLNMRTGAVTMFGQNEKTIDAQVTVPDSAWRLTIEAVYQVKEELWVISRVSRDPHAMGLQVITTLKASVKVEAPELPVRHFVIGKTWNWEGDGRAASAAVAEVGAELGHQPLRPVGGGLEFSEEEPQHPGLLAEAQAADQVAVAVQPGQPVLDVRTCDRVKTRRGMARRISSRSASRSVPSGWRTLEIVPRSMPRTPETR